MESKSKPRMPELRKVSLTLASRFFLVAAGGALGVLTLLLVHVFVPVEWLQLCSIWILGGSLLFVWAGILAWRIPVLGNGILLLFAIIWGLGIAAAVWLAVWSVPNRLQIWQHSMQWLSLTLSFVVGALLLRSLLRKRAAPLIGRLLSLISPLVILLVILLTSLVHRT